MLARRRAFADEQRRALAGMRDRTIVIVENKMTFPEEEEAAVYRQLVAHNWRLEQERISYADVQEAVGRLRLPPRVG